VKKIIGLLVFVITLSSCQKAEEEGKAITATTSVENKTGSSSSSSNNFSLLVELPYEVIQSDETCEKPIVREFFAYQCPHCNKLEKYAAKWKANNLKKINFQAIPTHLGKQEMGPYLIVHHAADQLGLLNQAIPALFKRFHKENKNFSSQDQAINFLVSVGASKEDATKTVANQEAVTAAAGKDYKLLEKYKISSVPTIIVNNRYQITVTQAGGYEKVFEVVEQTLKLPSNCSEK